MPEIFFEDLVPGTVTTFGAKRVTADEIVAFARQYDAQPFHLGEERARDTFAGRLIASGWHTIGMEMRMLCDGWLLRSASMGSPGIDEVRWLTPVLPGDELTVRQTILDAKASRSRPEMGVVQFRFETLNRAGEIVMSQTNPIMFARRHAGEQVGASEGRASRPPSPADNSTTCGLPHAAPRWAGPTRNSKSGRPTCSASTPSGRRISWPSRASSIRSRFT
jgi:acyl dehydratase